MARKAALHNLGCKVNAYELEVMRQMLEEAGYEIVPFEPGADVYVINTCTVTNIADRKSRQMLHRARRLNPEAVVAAVGCYAQTRAAELSADPDIDLVIGNNRKTELVSLLDAFLADRRKRSLVSDLTCGRSYEKMQISRTEEHTRAFMKVQDGCDQFCSYCIIPYARGRVRSRHIDEVRAEAEALAAAGFREIVLTGIHLCSYGRDLDTGEDLTGLIRAVHGIDGISRIRLGSLEPGSVDEPFVRAISALPKVCPHFHLSLQSGCDRTLRRMNRRYTTEEFSKTADLLRQYYDRPALTTDIITGFPGETDEDFEESRRFVEKTAFFETHVFPYSRREGTRAASMPDQLTEAVKKERSAVLLELNARRREEYLRQFAGETIDVLFEEETETDEGRFWCGHGDRYQKVLAESDENLAGKTVKVGIRAFKSPDFLIGIPIKQDKLAF